MKRFALGLTVMFIVAMVPIRFWRNMSVVAYLISLALLVAVEMVGSVGMGAQRWIDLGFMRLQPSELTKIALVVLLAAYYDWLPTQKTSRPLWVLIPVVATLIPRLTSITTTTIRMACTRLPTKPSTLLRTAVAWKAEKSNSIPMG